MDKHWLDRQTQLPIHDRLEEFLSSAMPRKRYIMNAGRTTKQGQQINVGKDSAAYQELVSTITMHPDDMKEEGIVSGGRVRARSENGEAVFICKEGKVPSGLIFVPYGPPTCRLMGQYTDGTGMPTSKGWEVEVEPLADDQSATAPGSEHASSKDT
jgi:formylmethanofuran dehydrogenase subunit D